MASIKELKARIDIHDLAERLGLERPHAKGNYRSPHHKDKSPSVQIFDDGWRDYSHDEGGDHIDLVCYVRGCDKSEAMKWLHAEYGIAHDKPDAPAAPVQRSRAEWIAEQCMGLRDRALEYLVGRKISESVAQRAIEKGVVGFNAWTSATVQPGEFGHGGDAVAFIVKSLNPGRVLAVDMRYLDPDLNGGVKTQTHGEKYGVAWVPDAQRLKKAHRVVVVESAINALSIDTCNIKGTASLALRGTGNASRLDLTPLRGKQVLICMDNDAPDEHGERPGAKAAWTLYERLVGQDIAAQLVDWSTWVDAPPAAGDTQPNTIYNDVNDILQAQGADGLRARLELEPWVIPGLPGKLDHVRGKPRAFLPAHDFSRYWRYRAKEDFTTVVTEREDKETGEVKTESEDLCGFRVAAITRVTVASATATMSGEEEMQPDEVFAVSVQVPDRRNLVREVFKRERIYNADHWQKLGPVFGKPKFLRMVNMLMRASHLGGRSAANFVGLCWKDGALAVNEGADCYFQIPEQQCAYHGLSFPSGSPADARRVLEAYQATFQHNAAALLLVWSLGGHLKLLLDYWPHMTVQAEKGSGKSTLIKRLERTIAFTMFASESIKTEFRLLTSISCTSHPVGWEEFSALRQDIIDRAVGMLQQSYQYSVTRRGAELIEFNMCAPVLLAGEDVPVKSLTGKVVRASLREKGPMLADDLPRFPVRQWLQFLAGMTRRQVKELHGKSMAYCWQHCRATGRDAGASRMVENYAAMLTAWALLCEFLELPTNHGNLIPDLLREMNEHIAETSGDREPWVWIVQILLDEIASGKYRMPYSVDRDVESRLFIAVMPSQVMHHLRTDNGLRSHWDALPVKSDRAFKKQLQQAGVILKDDVSITVGGRRQTHMIALDAEKLATYGLHVAESELVN